jgi:predicted dehydrogenase
MVGHLLHYHPIFKEIKKIVKEGQIGKLEYIQSNRLSFGKFRIEEDIIWSFAPHDISMILSLANEKPSIVKCNSKFIIKENHADIANIYMEFPSGLKSDISVSWINPLKEVKLVVTGKSGMLVFDDTKTWNEKLTLHSYEIYHSNELNLKNTKEEYIKVVEEEPLKNECQHFISVVKDNLKPFTDVFEGLKVIKVLTAASLANEKK